MRKYRTAQGKMLDMGALAAKNEKVRAVGNMKVNARGDSIDSAGRVIQPVTSKVNDGYNKTVGNKSARTGKHTNPSPFPPRNVTPPKKEEMELTEYEKELEQDLEDDIEVEKIKAKEVSKTK